MENNNRIRLGDEGDLERVGEIIRRAWKPVYEIYRNEMGEELYRVLFDNWGNPIETNVRRHQARHPDWFYVVTSVETTEVVAFITFWLDREKQMGTIGLNAVAPESQGQGIGKMMYTYVLDLFRQEGLKYAAVRTGLEEGHVPARRAYEKAGFNIVRKDVRYYMYL